MDVTALQGTLSRPVSRRAVLQGLGAGVALAALGVPQARAATLTGSAPSADWTYDIGDGSYSTAAGYGAGRVYLVESFTSSSNCILDCVDSRTGQRLWYAPLPMGLPGGLVVGPGAAYVASRDATAVVVSLDAVTGAQRWRTTVPGQIPFDGVSSGMALVGGLLVVLTGAGSLVALDATTGTQRWVAPVPPFNAASLVSTAPAAVAGVVTVAVGTSLLGFDARTGAAVDDWQHLALQASFLNQPAAGGGAMFLSYWYGQGLPSPNGIAALSLTSALLWTSPSAPTSVRYSSPVVDGGLVLVGDSGGGFSALDMTTGTKRWSVSLTAGGAAADLSQSAIVVDDGIAYLTSAVPQDTPGTALLYAVDLTSRAVVQYDTRGIGYQVVGVEAGVVYYAQADQYGQVVAGAVSLAAVLHGYYAGSRLMADDYVPAATGTGQQPATPTWRSHLQLLDATGTPRSGKAVRVWTDTAATITSAGRSYPVSPTQAAWLSTDPSGELAITVAATPATAQAANRGLGCAALYVWGSFMLQGEAIVLYPDHETMTSLAGVQGSHLMAARTYAGAPMLPTSYSASDADQLASTVRNTMGQAGASLAATAARGKGIGKGSGQRPGKNKGKGKGEGTPPPHAAAPRASPGGGYIAYPGSTTNLLYQPTIGPTVRQYVPTTVASWTASFSGGKVTFTPGTAPGASRTPPKAGSIFTDFKDFLTKVVHGAETVTSIVWKAVGSVVHAIVNGVDAVFQFVVDTVEKAAAVVAAILKTVVGDLVKVIEALSFVLSWGTIVDTHDQLRQQVTANAAALTSAVAAGGAVATVESFFSGLESSVTSAFSSLEADLTGTTVAGATPAGMNPASVYGRGGAKAYTPSRWASEKVKQNAPSMTYAAGAASAGGGAALSTTLNQLATTIEAQVVQDFAGLPAQLRALSAALWSLTTDGSASGSVVLADLLRVVGTVVAAVVRLAGQVVGDLLNALGQIVTGIMGWLTTPIHIPLFSALYSDITGGSALTLLDLFCLVIAIPATLVYEAVQATAAPGALSTSGVLQFCRLMAMAFYTVFDALSAYNAASLQTFPGLYVGLWATVAVVDLLTGIGATDFADPVQVAFWALQLFPIGLLILSAAAFPDATAPKGLAFFRATVGALVVYGGAMEAFAIAMAVTRPSWRGTKNLLAVQNCLSFGSSLFSFLVLSPSLATAAAVETALFDGGALVVQGARMIVS